jgi:hypothetical protein
VSHSAVPQEQSGLAALVTGEIRPVVHAAEGDEVEYTFDRPITQGEEIYNWYRKTHADEAAKRYGVNPDAVTDGRDTWHWWTRDWSLLILRRESDRTRRGMIGRQ